MPTQSPGVITADISHQSGLHDRGFWIVAMVISLLALPYPAAHIARHGLDAATWDWAVKEPHFTVFPFVFLSPALGLFAHWLRRHRVWRAHFPREIRFLVIPVCILILICGLWIVLGDCSAESVNDRGSAWDLFNHVGEWDVERWLKNIFNVFVAMCSAIVFSYVLVLFVATRLNTNEWKAQTGDPTGKVATAMTFVVALLGTWFPIRVYAICAGGSAQPEVPLQNYDAWWVGAAFFAVCAVLVSCLDRKTSLLKRWGLFMSLANFAVVVLSLATRKDFVVAMKLLSELPPIVPIVLVLVVWTIIVVECGWLMPADAGEQVVEASSEMPSG